METAVQIGRELQNAREEIGLAVFVDKGALL